MGQGKGRCRTQLLLQSDWKGEGRADHQERKQEREQTDTPLDSCRKETSRRRREGKAYGGLHKEFEGGVQATTANQGLSWEHGEGPWGVRISWLHSRCSVRYAPVSKSGKWIRKERGLKLQQQRRSSWESIGFHSSSLSASEHQHQQLTKRVIFQA